MLVENECFDSHRTRRIIERRNWLGSDGKGQKLSVESWTRRIWKTGRLKDEETVPTAKGPLSKAEGKRNDNWRSS